MFEKESRFWGQTNPKDAETNQDKRYRPEKEKNHKEEKSRAADVYSFGIALQEISRLHMTRRPDDICKTGELSPNPLLDQYLQKEGLRRIWTPPDSSSFYHCVQYQDAIEGGHQNSFRFTKSGVDKKRIEVANLFSEKLFALKLDQLKERLQSNSSLNFTADAGLWLEGLLQETSDRKQTALQDPHSVAGFILDQADTTNRVRAEMNAMCDIVSLGFHRHIIVYSLHGDEPVKLHSFVPKVTKGNSAPKLTHYMAYTDPGHFEVVIPIDKV